MLGLNLLYACPTPALLLLAGRALRIAHSFIPKVKLLKNLFTLDFITSTFLTVSTCNLALNRVHITNTWRLWWRNRAKCWLDSTRGCLSYHSKGIVLILHLSRDKVLALLLWEMKHRAIRCRLWWIVRGLLLMIMMAWLLYVQPRLNVTIGHSNIGRILTKLSIGGSYGMTRSALGVSLRLLNLTLLLMSLNMRG